MADWDLEEERAEAEESTDGQGQTEETDHEETDHEAEERFAAAVANQTQRPDALGRFVESMRKRDAMDLMVPPPEKGQGRQIRGTIDVHMGLFISRLIASRKWPWKDENAFVRSAVSHLIRHARLDHDEEYAGYFKLFWDMTRRARLIQRLSDVDGLVTQIEGAARAYLKLEEAEEAAAYLKGEVEKLRAAEGTGDEVSGLALRHLEKRFTETGGPALLAVWRMQ